MTWQMMLALTVPPSAAYVVGKVMAWLEARALAVAEDQVGRLDALRDHASGVDVDLTGFREGLDKHEAELKRLNEQLSLVADRCR